MEKDNIKTIRDFMIPQFTLISTPEQDEIIRQREQEAEREREKDLLVKKKLEFEKSGVPKRYWNESFETWKVRNTDDEKRLQAVIEYSHKENNDSVLLMLGPKGVGKTHLGSSIIRDAGGTFIQPRQCLSLDAASKRRFSVELYSSPSLRKHASNSFDFKSPEN